MVIDCIIPARAGSKGILKKNISMLNGFPLLAYSIAAAKLSKEINNVYISTDSEEFAKISEIFGAKVLYLRPQNISKDDSIDIEFFKYHLDFINKKNLIMPDFFVNLRPTTPLREADVIDDAIGKFKSCQKATSLRSAHKVRLTPYKMFQRKGNFMNPYLVKEGMQESHSAARQFFEDAYVGNGYVDVLNPNLIVESGVLYGENIYLYETDTVMDIDTNKDLIDCPKNLNDEKYRPLLNYLEGCK